MIEITKRNCRRCDKIFRPKHPSQFNCSISCTKATASQSSKNWASRNRNYRNEYNKKYNQQHSERVKDTHYFARYGITLDEARIILESQSGLCAICKRVLQFGGKKGRDAPCINHSHLTGKVRGILCTSCNLLIGYASDSKNILESASNYLEKNV